jgi:hypothetical protein
MRSIVVSPSATRPAMTRLADAPQVGRHHGRAGQAGDAVDDRGVAVDLDAGAEPHQLVDVHEAVLEDRLGDLAEPSAMQSSAMNWACMSVGNAGYSRVRKLTCVRTPVAADADPVGARLDRRTGLAELVDDGRRGGRRGAAQHHVAAGRATAQRKVPASMRSGTMRWAEVPPSPCRRPTPWMRMRLVPCPSIDPPIAISISARSVISGSWAAFSRTGLARGQGGGHH